MGFRRNCQAGSALGGIAKRGSHKTVGSRRNCQAGDLIGHKSVGSWWNCQAGRGTGRGASLCHFSLEIIDSPKRYLENQTFFREKKLGNIYFFVARMQFLLVNALPKSENFSRPYRGETKPPPLRGDGPLRGPPKSSPAWQFRGFCYSAWRFLKSSPPPPPH